MSFFIFCNIWKPQRAKNKHTGLNHIWPEMYLAFRCAGKNSTFIFWKSLIIFYIERFISCGVLYFTFCVCSALPSCHCLDWSPLCLIKAGFAPAGFVPVLWFSFWLQRDQIRARTPALWHNPASCNSNRSAAEWCLKFQRGACFSGSEGVKKQSVAICN